MAVRIRLRRQGRRNRAFFRVVVTDKRSPRDGRFIEQVGYYDPVAEPPVIKLKEDRIAYWVGVGALPSDSVKDLLRRSAASGSAAGGSAASGSVAGGEQAGQEEAAP